MVSLADRVVHLVPDARAPRDFLVGQTADGPAVVRWSHPTAPQPTPQELAAVTDGQALAARRARVRADGLALVSAGADPLPTIIRGSDSAGYTRINDVAEYARAVLSLIAEAAAVAYPTEAAIAARVTSLRAPEVVGAPTPAQVAATGGRRILQAEIVSNIAATVAAGGGDPIPPG